MAEDDVARYQTNLRGEVDSAGLYRALAEAETDPHLGEVYRRLAAVEEAHAEFWRRQLDRVGVEAAAQPRDRTVDLGPVAAADQVGRLELVRHRRQA